MGICLEKRKFLWLCSLLLYIAVYKGGAISPDGKLMCCHFGSIVLLDYLIQWNGVALVCRSHVSECYSLVISSGQMNWQQSLLTLVGSNVPTTQAIIDLPSSVSEIMYVIRLERVDHQGTVICGGFEQETFYFLSVLFVSLICISG